MIDLSKTQFISDNTIDRIVSIATKDTTGSLSGTLPAGSDVDGKTYKSVLTNPSGLEAIVTLSFSLDNVNFYPATTVLTYYNSDLTENLIDLSVYAVATDSEIRTYFFTQNPASKTVYWNIALGVF